MKIAGDGPKKCYALFLEIVSTARCGEAIPVICGLMPGSAPRVPGGMGEGDPQ